jgi:succinate-acetate transporter protein
VSNEAAVAEQSPTVPLGAAAAPLGYLALGITLLAFGLLGTGIVNDAGVRDAGTLALFVGGIALLLSGLLEFHGSSAATGTAFVALGAFWLTWAEAAPAGRNAVGLFLLLWALIALSLTAAHWGSGRIVRDIYGLFTIALLLLAVADLAGNETLGRVAGWIAAAAGLLAWYRATSALSNGNWGRLSLPVR